MLNFSTGIFNFFYDVMTGKHQMQVTSKALIFAVPKQGEREV